MTVRVVFRVEAVHLRPPMTFDQEDGVTVFEILAHEVPDTGAMLTRDKHGRLVEFYLFDDEDDQWRPYKNVESLTLVSTDPVEPGWYAVRECDVEDVIYNSDR